MTTISKIEWSNYPISTYQIITPGVNPTKFTRSGRHEIKKSQLNVQVLSDYRQKAGSPVVDGWRAANPYIRRGFRIRYNLGLWTRVTETASERMAIFTNDTNVRRPPTPIVDGYDSSGYGSPNYNLEAQAVNEAIEALRQSKASVGLFIAEAKLSSDMLVKRGDVLFRAMRAMRNPAYGGFDGARRVLGLKKSRFGNHVKDWHTFVLEYQYGWKPFLSDLHDMYGAFQSDLLKAVPMVKGRSSASETVSSSRPVASPFGLETASGTKRVTAAFYGEHELSSLRAASQLGLINPLEILWERVPYSFLVDWAFPVGQVISNMTGQVGLKFRTGTVTHSSKINSRFEFLPNGTLGWQVLTPAVAEQEHYSCNRRIETSLPVPLPYVRNPFSTQRAINASALFAQTRLR